MAGSQAHAGDPYLWLEEIEGKRALDWVAMRNKETMASLGADPLFDHFKAEALAILTAQDRIPMPALRAGWIYNFWQDDSHLKGIWRRTSWESYKGQSPDWDVVLDIDALAKSDRVSWVYKGVTCLAPKFERCLVRLSDGGKDAVTVREFDTSSKSFVDGGFELDEAKQNVDWLDRDSVLVARGINEDELTDSGYPRVIRLLKRGEKLGERAVLYEAPRSFVSVAPRVMEHDGVRIALLSRSPSFFENEFAVLAGSGEAIDLPLPRDCEVRGFYLGDLILSLRSDWSIGGRSYPAGAFVSFPLAPVLAGGVPRPRILFMPAKKRAAQGLAVSSDAVYITLLDNVLGRVEAYRLNDGVWSGTAINVGDKGSVDIAAASPFESRLFVTYEDFLTPARLVTWDRVGAKPEILKSLPLRFDSSSLEVGQTEALSADGTPVPYFLVRKKGASGPVPTLLYAYGGFEVALEPGYSGVLGKLWLERGGQYALANIRGGGEFGPKWHQAALKGSRQRAFDDFNAVAEDLIERKLAHKRGVGIMGGSNGGLLVAVAMTQRPDLYGAVVCQVPLLDMLRFSKLLAGASWMGEYGNPDKPDERAYIEAYSPYQRLSAGVDYPEPFIWTSTRDDRVHPGHARKFVARLLELGHKVHYFERIEGGHSAGANLMQAAEHYALEYTYLARRLMLDETDPP